MKFWNWGPTTIWHNMTCGQNCFQKSLHPNAQHSFHFQKTAGAFIMNILQNPFLYINEQSPIIKFEIKSCLIFLKIPKNGQNGF